MQLSSEALSFHAVQRTYSCAHDRTYLKIDLYFEEIRIILRTGSTTHAGCRVCLCSFELYDTLYENEKNRESVETHLLDSKRDVSMRNQVVS